MLFCTDINHLMLKKVEKCFSLLNFSWLLWIHLKSTCEMFTWKMNDTCNFLHMAIFLITYLCLFLYYPILCHWSLSVSSENMISGIKKKNGGMKWVKTWRLHVIYINIYSFTPKIEELYGVQGNYHPERICCTQVLRRFVSWSRRARDVSWWEALTMV